MELLQKYAELRAQMSALQDQESLLKMRILQDLEKRGVKTEKTIFGSFTVGEKKNYTYSKKIQSMEENLKLAQFKEREQGKVKIKITKYLTYKN